MTASLLPDFSPSPPTSPPPVTNLSTPGTPPPAPLRNPGWQRRIVEGTTGGFVAGLAGGALYAIYNEKLNVAPVIAGTAGNFTLVTATFLGCRELTRLMRQTDDWMNSAVGGALSGSMCGRALYGSAHSISGALLFGTVLGGVHFLSEEDASGDLYKLVGFQAIERADGTKDWVTPGWFPIRRISDRELEANEIEFKLRVAAVL
eukprot:CAMPEP_0198680716 /NCGR_PEP_ID=MMETSP1468-20131203/5361_1 /TAXON_ID=1461545 /ORGANISM="Mantoniella sp, Strain CCMP1436" /LENGTH=203 /DNA_ID=CAMNT_0044421391 /DNA_START=196 /DNA_END=803 /DNA_ORIENTATION=-